MDERLQVLELIEGGEIDVEEGLRRIEALKETRRSPIAFTSRPTLVNIVWQAVFWFGVILLAGGGLLVAGVYAWEIAAGWRVFGWVLFVVGLLVMLASWWSSRARWFSVRVRRSEGPNINMAFPMPLSLVAWGVRVAQPFVPQLRGAGLDELILAMRDELKNGPPLVIEVDETEEGEQVQVCFG